MKSIVENLSATRVKLAVEVPFDELKDKFDAAYKRIGQQVRVPGFRPGKVPAKILEARVGRGAVLQDVVNEALPEAYAEACQENGLKVIGQPEIEVNDISDTEFKFTAETDIRPEITVPDLASVEATVEDPEVTDEEIDQQISGLRDRFSTLKGVDRAVGDGDFVSLDLRATVDGEEVEGGSASGLSYEVGTGQLVPGIDEQLVGMTADEEKSFTSALVAGEHAGRDAEITVTVKSVKEKELPELDDDFASMASEFDTLDELKADLRERLERAKSFSRIALARDAVMEAIVEKVDFELPEGALKTELEARRHDAVHSFDHDEDQLNAWIESEGKTREEFDKEIEENAAKSLRAQLVLDQIVDDEGIDVDDAEMTQYIIQQAGRYGMAPQQFADEIAKAGQVGALVADVRRNKALDQVLSKATVKDSSGAALDLEAIRAEAIASMGQTMTVGDDAAEAEGEDADATAAEDTAGEDAASTDEARA
ncbi:trigger factor [Cumulibacter manganitolerans]|uniref:trigger factor n=1 Tax=Cumulibacter manganitolerans TaxID=1884992 RepID=UPI001294D57C|nr:trigger factor [Cumulibacter manganitolerans]